MVIQPCYYAIADISCPFQRGLVPAMKYSGSPLRDEILTESAIVAQFLCDAHPSHLLPASDSSPEAALFRARVNFFVDTWNTKVGTYMWSMFRAENAAQKEAKSKEWVAAVEKEIEPLLQGCAPFFGGSKDMTLAEVRTFGVQNADVFVAVATR